MSTSERVMLDNLARGCPRRCVMRSTTSRAHVEVLNPSSNSLPLHRQRPPRDILALDCRSVLFTTSTLRREVVAVHISRPRHLSARLSKISELEPAAVGQCSTGEWMANQRPSIEPGMLTASNLARQVSQAQPTPRPSPPGHLRCRHVRNQHFQRHDPILHLDGPGQQAWCPPPERTASAERLRGVPADPGVHRPSEAASDLVC